MKINILQGAFYPVPPIHGGAVEKLWFELGKAFVRKGHEVCQVSKKDLTLLENEMIEGVCHKRVQGYSTPRSILWLKFLDLLYTRRACRCLPTADITVANTFWAPFFRTKGHGKMLVDVQRMPKGQFKFYPQPLWFRANSMAVKEALLRAVPPCENRITMIPNPLPFSVTEDPHFEQKEKVILYVGRIHEEKGIELLLQAFSEVLANGGMDWKLMLVGPWETKYGGSGEAFYDRLNRDYAHPQISWVGPVFEAERLNALYQRSSVFAYPSLAEKGETFGLAVLEAMAWGAVPVVSELDCFKDFVRNGENGFIFNHRDGDAVGQLARALTEACHIELRPYQLESIKVRDTHSIEVIADQFLEYFETLISP